MSQDRIKVLYIGGYGRSGSTLLDRLLGQFDGFHAIGEANFIWQWCFADNQLCGCGQPFRECEFWRAVVKEAFGGFDALDLDGILALRQRLASRKFLPLILYPRLRTAEQQKVVDAYLQVLKKLYTAIHTVSGSRVIVDSSKGPRYSMLLNEIPEIDLRVVHLVRDSRAVVYSWQKKVVRTEVYWKTQYIDRPSPVRASLNWNIVNLLIQSFHRDNTAYLFARYEDLVESPRATVAKIVQFTGEEVKDDQLFVRDNLVRFSTHHTAAGNPNRFRQGTIEVRRDDEWQKKMPKRERVLVTTITLPLLRRYGYLGSHTNGLNTQIESMQRQGLPQDAGISGK